MKKVLLIIPLLLVFGCVQQEEPTPTEPSFSIIVLPDTQVYSLYYPEIFTNQTQWIINNKDSLNIQFVIHEGDIVNNWNSTPEWDNANYSLSLLDKNTPYSVIPGNHDHSTTKYNEYFPVARFSSNSWWGGNYSENDNNYQLLTIGQDDYLFISLDFCPTSDEIKWANEILTNHSNRKVILTTHAYLDDTTETRTPHTCGNTDYIWNDLVKQYDNLKIVLCGHEHDPGEDGQAYRMDYNLAGKPVHQILADYQDSPSGGNGWLRIMEFVPSEDKIYVKTYSPYLNKYNTDSAAQFTLNYEMKG